MGKKKYSQKSYEILISWKEIFVKTILTGSFSAEYLSYTSPQANIKSKWKIVLCLSLLLPHFCVEF